MRPEVARESTFASMSARIVSRAATFSLLVLMGGGVSIVRAQTPAPPSAPIRMSSPAFEENGTIPDGFTCQAKENVKSPQIDWNGAPPNTVSFVLLVHDLDPHPNRSSNDVLHWLVWNIPGDAQGLPENVKPDVSDGPGGSHQGFNQRGKLGWAGPCPPVGHTPHHYTFELFALDTKLNLDDKATRQDVIAAMDAHVLAHGVLIGRFSRK